MKNPLSVTHPELCEEWSDKNTINPDQVTEGSHDRVWWKGRCGHEWQTVVWHRTLSGTGCPYCCSNKMLRGFNDLATLKPDVAKSWSEKNLPLTPDQVMPYSKRKVWWKCEKGHEWKGSVNDRSKGKGCPYCAKVFLLKGFNDLATRYPNLAKEWSDRNEVKLDELLSARNKTGWWKCSTCGQEYQRSLYVRATKNFACPYCDGRELIEGFNDLKTTHPKLAEEWNYEKNNGCEPNMITFASRRFAWWKCKYGHTFGYKVKERTIDKKNCSFCKAEFQAVLPQLSIIFYAEKLGLEVKLNHMINKNLSVQLYVLELNTIVELQEFSEERCLLQLNKLERCKKKGFEYVIVRKSYDTEETMEEIRSLFQQKGYTIDWHTENDVKILEQKFFEIKDEILRESETQL